VKRLVFLLVLACGKDKPADPAPAPAVAKGSGAGSAASTLKHSVQQIPPPDDLKAPPADATKLPDGLAYKKLVTNDAGTVPGKNDSVLLNYTGWKQSTGETFFTTRTHAQPMQLSLATTAPGFAEAVAQLKKGEKALAWIPPDLTGTTLAGHAIKRDTLVYELEVMDVTAAPAVPADVAAPPASAQTIAGVKVEIVKSGTGKDKPRAWDTVSFQSTGWDATGKMFDTTEMRNRAAVAPPYKQAPLLEHLMETMVAGERLRFWTDSEAMNLDGRPPPGLPKGAVCYEVEVVSIAKAASDPPPVPVDVAKPPDDATKTEKGTFYKILKAGPAGGTHPKATDAVRVHYTGWRTDGRMFDSSVVTGNPAQFSLGGVIVGWTDAFQQLVVGDKARLWIPAELAYKGAPGKPQGMLVFDVELLEIKAPAPKRPPQLPMPKKP
jgi:peptidylprolyl isomerase